MKEKDIKAQKVVGKHAGKDKRRRMKIGAIEISRRNIVIRSVH